MNTTLRIFTTLMALLLAACGAAEYGGEVATPAPVEGGGGAVQSCDELFT